ncbi:MAG: hypothetical protein AAGK02_00595 [Pseudomonadota bacterium]
MFGADTPLVIDALQVATLAALGGAAAFGFYLKSRKSGEQRSKPTDRQDLEDRVRVLERIATDRSLDLADEIEELRETPTMERNA